MSLLHEIKNEEKRKRKRKVQREGKRRRGTGEKRSHFCNLTVTVIYKILLFKQWWILSENKNV